MPRIKFNSEDVGDAFENIPAGKYLARLTDVQEYTSDKGNPTLYWQWEIAEGDYAGNQMRSFTSLLDHALFGLKQHCEAFGEEEGEIDVDTDEYIGKMAVITVSIAKVRNKDTGEMQERNRVEKVEQYKKGRKKAGGGAKKRRAPREDEEQDEEVPF